MEDFLVYVPCRLSVEFPNYVFGLVGFGGDKVVIAHAVIDIFLVSPDSAAVVSDKGVGGGVLKDLPVGGDSAGVPGPAHQRDVFAF